MNPLLLGGAAFVGVTAVKPKTVTGGITPGQPSQKYPFRAPTPVRADNASQPWAGFGIQSIVKQASTQIASDPMGSIKAGSSVVHSLSDVWGNLSGIFGTNDSDPSQNLSNPDQVPNNDETATGSFNDQSNSVGEAVNYDLGYDNSSSYDLGVDYSMGGDNY